MTCHPHLLWDLVCIHTWVYLEVCCFVFPQGSAITTLLSSVLFDKSEWETPDVFNPNHFLDSEGRFRKRDAFLPFSAGLILYFHFFLCKYAICKHTPGCDVSQRTNHGWLPAGKRVCLGESLAKMELFLFFTSILQRFKLSPVPGQIPSLEGNLGFTYSPQSFRMIAAPR